MLPQEQSCQDNGLSVPWKKAQLNSFNLTLCGVINVFSNSGSESIHTVCKINTRGNALTVFRTLRKRKEVNRKQSDNSYLCIECPTYIIITGSWADNRWKKVSISFSNKCLCMYFYSFNTLRGDVLVKVLFKNRTNRMYIFYKCEFIKLTYTIWAEESSNSQLHWRSWEHTVCCMKLILSDVQPALKVWRILGEFLHSELES